MKLLFALLLKCPIKALQLKCRDIQMRLRHPAESHSDLFQKFILNGRTLFCIATDILNTKTNNCSFPVTTAQYRITLIKIGQLEVKIYARYQINQISITKIFTYVFAIDRYIEVFLCFCLFLLHRGSFQLKVFWDSWGFIFVTNIRGRQRLYWGLRML